MPKVAGDAGVMLAAVLAAGGKSIDLWTIAAVMDESYNTVEGRLRALRKDGEQMMAQAKKAGRVDEGNKAIKDKVRKSNNPIARKVKTEKDDDDAKLHGVKTGRITKKTPKVKKEANDNDDIGSGHDAMNAQVM